MYRRAQAYEGQEQHEKAYADARAAQVADPKNREVQLLLGRLHKVVQDIMQQNSQMSNKVKQMFDLLFDPANEKEKREAAANNLVTLARERAGAQLLMSEGVLGRMTQLLKSEKNIEIKIGCIRTISELCKDMSKTKQVLQDIGLPWLIDMMNTNNPIQVNATQYCLQNMICTLSGTDLKKEKKSDAALVEENQKELDSIMAVLTTSITSRTVQGLCRDAILEIIIKNIPYNVLAWAKKFLKIGGLEKLLEVASELKDYHYESCIDVTENTKMTVAICLQKLYEEHADDKARENFVGLVECYINENLVDPKIESKVKVIVMLTTLLLGPIDVGSSLIAKEGILEMMLVMANTDEVVQQKVACEALIAAASKKDKCKSIITQGTDILKKLYQSKNNEIKVRALVGLCKLGSMGGTDATMKPFAEGAALKLADACFRFLTNPKQDKDLIRWACEGLSYLTLDADVKEKLCDNKEALKAMIEIAKTGDMNCLYGVTTSFVNICNAYDKQEIDEEMVKLAQFAKHHVPEEHELDDKDFVDKRICILIAEGAVSALVTLSKTESSNSRELISRLFLAFCEIQENRGLVVQQGATKALLNLSFDGTKKGKITAAHALSRIAITIDPAVAFPGQRAYEVVRPLLSLLHVECSGLENFEALMGLCNLAGMSESTRQRIIKEKGLPLIENYMFEHHDMIRRAAIQCMANMCCSPDIVKILEGPNDKFKYLFLCASDEDEQIISAAAGALCMVLSESDKLYNKIFTVGDWEEILKFLLSHPNKDIQYRGTVIVYFLVSHDKYTAEKIIDTHCQDCLKAIYKIEDPDLVVPKAREYALNTLKQAAKWKLIKDPEAPED